MSGWTRLCPAEAVPADTAYGVRVGEDRLCLARAGDGEVVALRDRCPHRDIALSGGLVRDGLLTCPGHFWRFDLADGARRTDDPTYAATRYPARVDEDGWVWVELPEPTAPLSMRDWLLAQARSPDAAGQPPPPGVSGR